MGKTTPKISTKCGEINIDCHIFDPILDSSKAIRTELDTLLEKSKPKKVYLEMPNDYSTYGTVYREIILPHVLLKSQELNYRVFMDKKSHEICTRQFGRHIKGNGKRGYCFP